jgi:histidine triad (HIT) family protein
MEKPETIQKMKENVLEQIKKMPADKQDKIKKEIDNMPEEEFLKFVSSSKNNCVFCSIIEGKTPTTKIEETKNVLAILELNPKSKGHTLILNKDHNGPVTDEMIEISKKISEKIIVTLKPKDVSVNEGKILGHTIIEIIPNYKEKVVGKRKVKSELEKVQEKILGLNKKTQKKNEPKKEVEKQKETQENKPTGLPYFSERIP